jgi:hypothetical protein
MLLLLLPIARGQRPSATGVPLCREPIAGRHYGTGETLAITLVLPTNAGSIYRADLTLVETSGDPSRSTANHWTSLVAFGVGVSPTDTRFAFMIPLNYPSGRYLISGLAVHELPGVAVSPRSNALSHVIGTCLSIDNNETQGVKGLIAGGLVESRSTTSPHD